MRMPTPIHTIRYGVQLLAVAAIFWGVQCSAFVLQVPFHRQTPVATSRRHSHEQLISSRHSIRRQESARPSSARDEFEWQELRVQLDAIQKQGVASRNLDPTVRANLLQYARSRAIRNPPSSVELEKMASLLPGSKWRLVLSNDAATLGDLPRDATVYLQFLDSQNVDYLLQFSELTFGLNSIKAKSTWNLDSSTGLVTFVYQKVTTDLFGFKDMGVGLFGLLKGRANYVETAYFDNEYWIELGTGPTGKEFINVYVRQQDADDNW